MDHGAFACNCLLDRLVLSQPLDCKLDGFVLDIWPGYTRSYSLGVVLACKWFDELSHSFNH